MNAIYYVNKVINNSFSFAFVKKGIVTVCSIVFVSILSRYLGPCLKGEYSAFMSWSSIAVIIMQMGFFKLYPNYRRLYGGMECKNIFFSISIYKFILFGLIFTSVALMEKIEIINMLFAISVIFSMLQGECLFLALIDNIKYQNMISIGVYVLNALDILLLYIYSSPNIAYIFIIFIIRDVVAICLCVFILKYRLLFEFNIIELIFKLTGKSLWPIIAALLVEMNYRVDVIFLDKMVDNYYVGLYASGVTLAEMAWLIPDVFKEVLFNKTAKDDNINEVCFSLRVAILTVGFCLVGIWLFGPIIIDVFFGSDYQEAYGVTLLIIAGVPFMALYKVLNPLIQARGDWQIYIATLFFSVLTNMVLNLFLIKILGMYGAAVSSVFSYAISGVGLLVYFAKTFNLQLKECVLVKKEDFERMKAFFRSVAK